MRAVPDLQLGERVYILSCDVEPLWLALIQNLLGLCVSSCDALATKLLSDLAELSALATAHSVADCISC